MTTTVAHTVDAEGRRVPDLDATFGRRFRIVWSQSRDGWPRLDLPWLRQIACRHGAGIPPRRAMPANRGDHSAKEKRTWTAC